MSKRILKNVELSQKRKRWREEKKVIESHLHPLPELIKGIEVWHYHRGRSIIFTAWRGNKQVNKRMLKYPRTDILYDKHFYNNNSLDFKWLMQEEKE